MIAEQVSTRTLEPGVTLCTARLPYAATVSVGVWVGAGSRHEPAHMAGGHHFLEHMLFRGTSRSDGPALARRMDELGGRANAFTTKEATCYYMDLLPEDLPEGLSLLVEMVTTPTLEESAVEIERKIIRQEMRTAADNPADQARELCLKACWGEHPLARPILGYPETVDALDAAALRRLHRLGYTPENTVVAVAGALDEEAVADLAARAFREVPSSAGRTGRDEPPAFCPSLAVEERPLGQAHLCLAAPGVAATSADLPAVTLLAAVLAGGTGSRLFQEMREKRGWAYRLDSAALVNTDAGLLPVYMAVDPKHAPEAVALVRLAFLQLAGGDIRPEEVERARKRAIRRVIMGAETPRAHMFRLGRRGLGLGRSEPPERLAAELARLTPADLRECAARLLSPDRLALGAVGPVREEPLAEILLGG